MMTSKLRMYQTLLGPDVGTNTDLAGWCQYKLYFHLSKDVLQLPSDDCLLSYLEQHTTGWLYAGGQGINILA